MPKVAYGMAMRIAYTGAAFLVGVVLARGLGVEAYGVYSFVLAWALIGAGLVQAGMPQLLVREIAAYRQQDETALARGIVGRARLFTAATAALMTLALVSAQALGLLGVEAALVLWLALPIVFLRAQTTTLQSATRGFGHVLVGQMSELLVRPVVQLALLAALWLGLLPVGFDPASAMAAYALATLAGFAFAWSALRGATRPLGQGPAAHAMRDWASGLWKLSVYGWLTAFTLNLSVLVIGLMGETVDVAQYRVAWQNAVLIPIGLTVMNKIQFPSLSAAHARGDTPGLQRLVARNCLFSLATALPLAMFLALFGEWFVLAVFGADYAAAVLPLTILAGAQVVNAGLGPVGLLLVAAREDRVVLLTQTATVLTNLVLAVLLVPPLGATGAAIATAAAFVVNNVVMLVAVRRRLGIWSLPLLRHARQARPSARA